MKEILFKKMSRDYRTETDLISRTAGKSERKKYSQSDFKLEIVTEEPIPSLEEKRRSSFYTFSVWS